MQCIWSLALASGFAAPLTPGELTQALSRYQSLEQLDVDFTQTKRLKDLGMELESSGHLRVKPPHFVEWRVLKPEPLTVELDDHHVSIESKSGRETLNSAGASEKDRRSFSSLVVWLKLDANEILKTYAAEKTGPRSYLFKPKTPTLFASIGLELTPQSNVASMRFTEASGDEMEIRFATPKLRYRKEK